MAFASITPTTSKHHHKKKKKKNHNSSPPPNAPTPSSWEHFKSLLSCRSTTATQIHHPTTDTRLCGSSICAIRDVVHGNTRVVHRADTDHNSTSSRSHETAPLARRHQQAPTKGGMQLRKLSGCYECQAIAVQPLSRYPRARTLSACSDCGEVFTKHDSLEIHQTLRHGVSELGPEDSGRSIVELIFKSSWQMKDRSICMIERILKVHNSQRTVSCFENYRDAVKARAHHPLSPRCAADGNELLRFHSSALSCPLGAHGSTALCLSSATASPCGVCTIIRHGFARAHHGVGTTATSLRAHECGPVRGGEGRWAMLVCRVIAGRVRRTWDDAGEQDEWYDSVAGREGANLEELFVASPRAILPCFVVIYRVLN